MTVEGSYFVKIGPALISMVRDLNSRAKTAQRRASKLPPGDRTEARRFEALHAAIDQCALASLWGDEPHLFVRLTEPPHSSGPSIDGPTVYCTIEDLPKGAPATVRGWLDGNAIVVELRLPHLVGETPIPGVEGTGPPPPAQRWQTSAKQRSEATRDRFRQLISGAVAGDGSTEAIIRPSDITNSVLTETLREQVMIKPDGARADLPVRYLDGSYGPPFPVRVLDLTPTVPKGWPILRFTLLSIRHVEMDAAVDGAWFRNAKISVQREAGLTDQLAFDTSIKQLRLLLSQGPTLIHIYQTGLETAVMGFYRALTHHLLENPGTVSVVPYYYNGPGQFAEGSPWTTA